MPFSSFKNHFLVAMPSLADTNFQQTVTYICEHHENGAMGLIINQPIKMTQQELFDYLSIECIGSKDAPLLYGGPVKKDRGFVLHTGEKTWESTLPITTTISLTGSKDILEDIAINQGPENAIVALGYAGWDAGQLEAEITANSWLTVPGDSSIIFEIAYDQRWTAAASKLGIDVNLIANHAGHS